MDYRQKILNSETWNEFGAIANDLYFIMRTQLFCTEDHVNYADYEEWSKYSNYNSLRKFCADMVDVLEEEYHMWQYNLPCVFSCAMDMKRGLLTIHNCLHVLGVMNDPARIIHPDEYEEEEQKRFQVVETINPFGKLEENMGEIAEALKILAVQNGIALNQKRISNK